MLSNLNSIILEGNLVRDPVIKAIPSGHNLCSFSVASNRFYKQNEETEKEVSYFDIETWSRLAQTCGEILKKGRGVRIVGRLKQDRWVDSTGKNQTKIKIVAEHVEFKPQTRKEPDTENAAHQVLAEPVPEEEAVF